MKKLLIALTLTLATLAHANTDDEIQMALIEVGQQVGEEYGLKWVNSTWRGNDSGQQLAALALTFQAPTIGTQEHAQQLIMAAAHRALELVNERADLKEHLEANPLDLENVIIGIASNEDEPERALLSCVSLEFGNLYFQ